MEQGFIGIHVSDSGIGCEVEGGRFVLSDGVVVNEFPEELCDRDLCGCEGDVFFFVEGDVEDFADHV